MGVKDIIYCLIFIFYIFITMKIIFLPSLIKVLQSDMESIEKKPTLRANKAKNTDQPMITDYSLYLA
jgi:hypothetical protein